jgi:dephospho-CoA kinase
VRRVLLTGMSGTGKTTLVRALRERGYDAVDTDDGWCEPLPDGRQQWREDAVAALLDEQRAGALFVAGCEENQVRFHPRFDVIVLLSTPRDVLLQRLATRAGNGFGKRPEELARVLADLAEVEPRLRAVADHEVDTSAGIDDVVDAILRLTAAPAAPGKGFRTAQRGRANREATQQPW